MHLLSCYIWPLRFHHFQDSKSKAWQGDKTSVLPLVCFFFHIFEVSNLFMGHERTKKCNTQNSTHIQHPNVPTSGCFCSSPTSRWSFFWRGPEATWNVHPPCQVPRLQRWFAPGVGSKGKQWGFFSSPQKQFYAKHDELTFAFCWCLLFWNQKIGRSKKNRHIYTYIYILYMTLVYFSKFAMISFFFWKDSSFVGWFQMLITSYSSCPQLTFKTRLLLGVEHGTLMYKTPFRKLKTAPNHQTGSDVFTRSVSLLLMAEILHQFTGSSSHYLWGFIHPRWCRILAINSMFHHVIPFHHVTRESRIQIAWDTWKLQGFCPCKLTWLAGNSPCSIGNTSTHSWWIFHCYVSISKG